MALPKFDPNRVPDREIKAKPGEEKCDFCSSTEPLWGFPCRGHVTGVVPFSDIPGKEKTVVASPDDWAACANCYGFILKADRDGLAQHSVAHMPRAYRRAVSPQVAMNAVRQAHDQFWANRDGDPYPMSGHAFLVYAVPKDGDDDMTEGAGLLHRRFTGPSAADAEFAAQEWVDKNESPDNPDRYEIREWTR